MRAGKQDLENWN